MINVDQEDDPLAVMGMHRTLAGAAAATIGVLSVAALLSSMALNGLTHLWNLGLAGLIASAVVGSYAGHLGIARVALRELACAEQADATRAQGITSMERTVLARLDGIASQLERQGYRDAQLADEVEELRAQVRQTAERVNAILEDELRQRRRYG